MRVMDPSSERSSPDFRTPAPVVHQPVDNPCPAGACSRAITAVCRDSTRSSCNFSSRLPQGAAPTVFTSPKALHLALRVHQLPDQRHPCRHPASCSRKTGLHARPVDKCTDAPLATLPGRWLSSPVKIFWCTAGANESISAVVRPGSRGSTRRPVIMAGERAAGDLVWRQGRRRS